MKATIIHKHGASSAVYGLGLIGAAVWFISQASGFWMIVLAILYGVPAKRLNEQVKRNKKRFPDDFMFQLTREENNSLRSQITTLIEKKPKKEPRGLPGGILKKRQR